MKLYNKLILYNFINSKFTKHKHNSIGLLFNVSINTKITKNKLKTITSAPAIISDKQSKIKDKQSELPELSDLRGYLNV